MANAPRPGGTGQRLLCLSLGRSGNRRRRERRRCNQWPGRHRPASEDCLSAEFDRHARKFRPWATPTEPFSSRQARVPTVEIGEAGTVAEGGETVSTAIRITDSGPGCSRPVSPSPTTPADWSSRTPTLRLARTWLVKARAWPSMWSKRPARCTWPFWATSCPPGHLNFST